MTVEIRLATLSAHGDKLKATHLRDLYAADPARPEKFAARLDDLLFDYSKQHVTDETMSMLFGLADAADLVVARDAMFRGDRINTTEDRAVLHIALRNMTDEPILVNGEDVMPGVHEMRARMQAFSDAVRSGAFTGATGKAFTDVVNIGIGGSDLGPAMVTAALAPFCDGPKLHFVSNVDGAHIADTLKGLNPETTLFLVASKTFTTIETLTNAETARAWLVAALGDAAVSAHFAAMSVNVAAAGAFGISETRVFPFEDWVGGRYSVWSCIGLPVAIAIGWTRFIEFLAGAHAVDRHFMSTPMKANIPVLMGLLTVWCRNGLGYAAQAVLPYDQRLNRFAAYLQQLDMESNGKRVNKSGETLDYATGPLVWGEPGTNGQHAFYQLLHQGTDIIPADFLLAANPTDADDHHHAILAANCFAQTEALMNGRTEAEAHALLLKSGASAEEARRLSPHKVFPGNRPTSTFLYKRLDPKTLGMLIALYEHKVFVAGTIWGINSFDQWGVELGKELAKSLLPAVKGEGEASASSAALVKAFQGMKG